MDDKRSLLKHFLAALAYRTQKALREAPAEFGDFSVGNQTRTPSELVRHMTSVLGYSRTFFVGGQYRPDALPTLAEEIERFHQMLETLAAHLDAGDPFLGDFTEERLLQGPFADAMTHAGQLAMLRRLYGDPIPPENFIVANVSADNLTPDQPNPAAPDNIWPEDPNAEACTD